MNQQRTLANESRRYHGQVIAGLSFGLFSLGTFYVYRAFLEHNPAAGQSGFMIPALLAFSSVVSFALALAIHRGKSISMAARFSPAMLFFLGYFAYLFAFNL